MEHFYRDTWVEVDLDAIEQNVTNALRLYKDREMNLMAVVKANGYGHGAVEVSQAALRAGASYLSVAFLDEALALRKAGIDAPILVMGLVGAEHVQLAIKHRITLTVYQLDWLEQAISRLHTRDKLAIHLKLDTGMGRIGLRREEDIRSCMDFISSHECFELEGVFTHFATADEKDLTYFKKQCQRFNQWLEYIREWQLPIRYVHCGNSAAGLRFPEKNFNMFRFGIAMYGLTPSPEITDELPFPLKQAFSLKSRLSNVKKLPKGEGISYGATYVTEGAEWIGTLPIGYADGWIRHHSNAGGHVLIDGKRAPFVGRICMDQCMIRLPKEHSIGDTVTLIGESDGKQITMDEVAKRLNTINYEIPCVISWRVPRIYFRDGQIISVKNNLL